MGFELKNKGTEIEICGIKYIYVTNQETINARAKIMNEIEALKADENKIENMNVMIKAMCDFVEDTFGGGTVEQIFGTNGKLKADFFDLLSLTKYIIDETSKCELSTMKKYAVIPDAVRKGKK